MAVTETVKKFWVKEIKQAINMQIQKILFAQPDLMGKAEEATKEYILHSCNAQADYAELEVANRLTNDLYQAYQDANTAKNRIEATLVDKLSKMEGSVCRYSLSSSIDDLIRKNLVVGLRAVSREGKEVAELIEKGKTAERMVNIITSPKELTEAIVAFLKDLDIEFK